MHTRYQYTTTSIRHVRRRGIKGFLILAVSGAVAASAWAQKPATDPCTIHDTKGNMPGDRRQVTPLIDHPLKDPSICKGPEGWYYLTGTDGTPIVGDGVDFENNDGARIWKSRDLKQWELVGKVMDLSVKHSGQDRPQDKPLGWWRYAVGKPGVPDSPMVRYVQAPEIHYLKGTFWIAYSISGEGTGLLKSKSGKAEGPYEPWGEISVVKILNRRRTHQRHSFRGGSASLFQDDDPPSQEGSGVAGGSVYWLYGDGLIAKLKDDLTGFAEPPRQLLCENPDKTGDKCMDYPRKVGRDGYHLIKRDGVYYLFATDFLTRAGENCQDVYVASSDKVYGPYSERNWSIPHCGQTTLFEGPDGRLMATYCGNDRHAAFRDRPGVVPMGMSLNDAVGYIFRPKKPLPRRLLNVNTERYLWHKLAPVARTIRDVYACVGEDGAMYYIGSHTKSSTADGTGGKLFLHRSTDMVNWEPIEVWDWEKQEKLFKTPYKYDPREKGGYSYMDPEVWPINGTFYIGYKCYGGNPGSFLLKSVSGKIAGPYEPVDITYDFAVPSFFQDDDKKRYLATNNKIQEVSPDMTSIVEETPERWTYPYDSSSNYGDGAGSMFKYNGKYVYFRCGQDSRHQQLYTQGNIHCYIWNYMVAPSLDGPWTREKVVGPHTGHSGVPVQDKFGNWWMPFFGCEGSPAMPCWGYTMGGMHPVEIIEENGELTIRLADKLPDYVEKALAQKQETTHEN